MPAAYPLPSWIQPADEAGNLARGIQLGESQARQRLLEKQQQFQEQQAAVDQARADMQFKAQSEDRARKFAAQQAYQRRVAAGEDPLKVLVELGPGMGQQQTAESAAIRAMAMQNRPTAPKLFDIGGSLVRAGQTGPAETLVPRPPPKPTMHVNSTTGEIIETNLDGTFKVVRPGSKTILTGEDVVEADRIKRDLDAAYAQIKSFGENTKLGKQARADITRLIQEQKALYKDTTAKPEETATPQTKPTVVRDASGKFVYAQPSDKPTPSSFGPTAVAALKSMSESLPPGMDAASVAMSALKQIPVKKLENTLGKSVESALRELLPNELLKKLGLQETPVTGPMAGRATDETPTD